MAFTLDTPIGTILEDPRAKAVVDKYAPDASNHMMMDMARGMSINIILAMPQAAQMGLTKEKAEKLLTEINKMVG